MRARLEIAIDFRAVSSLQSVRMDEDLSLFERKTMTGTMMSAPDDVRSQA
jgi:hypothetical protein